MNFTTKKFGAIAAAALSVAAMSANAAFEYDLRFADDGTTSKALPAAGGTFTLIAYAVITGNGSGLQAANTGNLAMFSEQISGGVATGGGVSSATALETQSGARNGTATVDGARAPYSNDGIGDWGSYLPVGGSGAQVNNVANLRYVGDDATDAATGPFFGGRNAGPTTATAEVPVARFVVSFSAAQVAAAPASGAATRFRLEIPYRTNSGHGLQLQWWENLSTATSSTPAPTNFTDVGVATSATNFSTVRAAYGQQFVQNAFVDFTAGTVVQPPTTFIDLVADGSEGGFADLGNAVQSVVLDITDSAKGYVDIVPSANPGNSLSPITYVALDINGAALPAGFSITGGTNVTGSAIGQQILAAYGSGLEVVFAFTELGNDVKFDFGTSGVVVDKILVVPEPTSVAALALGGLVALRRRRA
jgi:hypothetical protein